MQSTVGEGSQTPIRGGDAPDLGTPRSRATDDENDPPRRCGKTKKNGKPCGFRELCAKCGRCWGAHCECPEGIVATRKRRQAGGRASSAKQKAAKATPQWPLDHPLESAADVQVVVEWAMRTLNPKVAGHVRGLCETWLRAHRDGVIADQVKALAAKIQNLKQKE